MAQKRDLSGRLTPPPKDPSDPEQVMDFVEREISHRLDLKERGEVPELKRPPPPDGLE